MKKWGRWSSPNQIFADVLTRQGNCGCLMKWVRCEIETYMYTNIPTALYSFNVYIHVVKDMRTTSCSRSEYVHRQIEYQHTLSGFSSKGKRKISSREIRCVPLHTSKMFVRSRQLVSSVSRTGIRAASYDSNRSQLMVSLRLS